MIPDERIALITKLAEKISDEVWATYRAEIENEDVLNTDKATFLLTLIVDLVSTSCTKYRTRGELQLWSRRLMLVTQSTLQKHLTE